MMDSKTAMRDLKITLYWRIPFLLFFISLNIHTDNKFARFICGAMILLFTLLIGITLGGWSALRQAEQDAK